MNATRWDVVYDAERHCARICYQAGPGVRIGASELVFRQSKSGAKRGEHPHWHFFTAEEGRVLRMIAAAPALVQALEEWDNPLPIAVLSILKYIEHGA